ncbi:MAG: sulfatase-like hydrolase/transferase [Bacteroidales bacterium]|nr:sulfatase-like hydrolase/transferase [Bacteroidales bacterium]
MCCNSKDCKTAPVVTGILLLFSISLTALVFLTLLRCVFTAVNLPENSFDLWLIAKALLKGVQFDCVIVSFILAFPSLLILIFTFFNILPQKIRIYLNVWIFTLFPLVFILTIADIPYFAYFHDHLNINAFKWFEFFGDTMGMLFSDLRNYLYIILIFITIFLFVKTISYIEKRIFAIECEKKYGIKRFRPLPLALVYCGLLFIGMRGTLELYPLRVGDAYFCDNAFYNRVGIAPVFNIIESMKNNDVGTKKEIADINITEALAYVQQQFGIATATEGYDSGHPLCRSISGTEPKSYNVVIILMESVANINLDLEYKGKKNMPYLSALRDSCIYFPNFFSAGIHTNCGITATLYGFAPNFDRPTMTIPSDKYSGLPAALKSNGYSNLFFITGNPQYDRMNSFLYDNNIDKIYSQNDYPKEKIANNFGVQDDYLFEFGLGALENEKQPFSATFLTVSNHPPYIVPKEFKGRGYDDHLDMLAFADNSVQNFIQKALTTEWGKNTVFVLLGDHGYTQTIGGIYDMPLTFNHIPCFIITPDKRIERMEHAGGQIDITATVMGILQLPYSNNTMGIDILNQKREYIYFVSDTHIGCANDSLFYCYNFNSHKEHTYKIAPDTAITVHDQQISGQMREYCFNMMKVNFEAVRQKWTEK